MKGSINFIIRLMLVIGLLVSTQSKASENSIKTFSGHEGKVISSAVSQSGKLLATGSRDKTIRIWNIQTGKTLHILEGHTSTPRALDFSPNGKLLVSAGTDATLKLWNVATGKLVKSYKENDRYKGDWPAFTSVAFSPNGLLIAAGNKNLCVKIWNLDLEARIFDPYASTVSALTFSHDNKFLLTASDYYEPIELWDVESGKRSYEIADRNTNGGHQGDITSIVYSPDGSLIVSASDDKTVKLWNGKSNQLIKTFTGHKGFVNDVVFSSDGKFVISGAGDKTIKVWDTNTLKEVKSILFDGYVYTLSFSPDDYSIIAGGSIKSLNKYSLSMFNKHKANEAYGKLNKNDYLALHKFCLSFYGGLDIVAKATDRIANLVKSENSVPTFEWFISNYPNHSFAKKSIDGIYTLIQGSDNIGDLVDFVKKYEGVSSANKALRKIYALVDRKNKIKDYYWFVTKYPETEFVKQAIDKIYGIVEIQNNIVGYAWFIEKFSNHSASKTALKKLHEVAYEETKKQNSLEAYNDFIIAYPYSSQIKAANDIAYKIENDQYSGWFSNDDKNSRALLVKSKQMERRMNDVSGDNLKDGYRLVINRMNDLLQDKFPAEEATLRHLESEEFKDFYRVLKESLTRISSTLDKISNDTSNLTSLMKLQSKSVDQHFRDAAQSREMAQEYTRQHRYWERFIK